MNTVSHIPTGEVLFEFHHATFFARGELLFFNEEGAVVGMHDLQSGEICFGEKLCQTVRNRDVIIKFKEKE